MTSIIQENLKRGTIELVLLSMLKMEINMGMKLYAACLLEAKAVICCKMVLCIPSLYRLLDRGLISDHKELVKGYLAISEDIEAVINFKPETDEEVMP